MLNLREGIYLSPKNSVFLAAILERRIRPLSGKQNGLALFKSNIVDNAIIDLASQGMKRQKMLETLKEKGLLKKHVAITGLNKRMDGTKKNYVKQRAELDEKFSLLYSRVTAT